MLRDKSKQTNHAQQWHLGNASPSRRLNPIAQHPALLRRLGPCRKVHPLGKWQNVHWVSRLASKSMKIPWLNMVSHYVSFQMSFWVAKSFRASHCVYFYTGEADNALMDAAVLYLPSREVPCQKGGGPFMVVIGVKRCHKPPILEWFLVIWGMVCYCSLAMTHIAKVDG